MAVTGVALAADDGDHVIRRVIDEIIAADNRGDLETVLSLYSEDAILLPPGEEPTRGRATIEDRYRRIFATSTLDLIARVGSVRVANGWAVARGVISGTVTVRSDRRSRRVEDKFVMVLEQQKSGGWLIAELIWSSNFRANENREGD